MDLKLKKGSSIGETIDYMSLIIAHGKLRVATVATKALKAVQCPTTVSRL